MSSRAFGGAGLSDGATPPVYESGWDHAWLIQIPPTKAIWDANLVPPNAKAATWSSGRTACDRRRQ
ncbi:MAG: hypothetical protein JOZ69_00800 [Myxococcales bacterium]|nr:hypothetical protein [Myxococcales bacterium]